MKHSANRKESNAGDARHLELSRRYFLALASATAASANARGGSAEASREAAKAALTQLAEEAGRDFDYLTSEDDFRIVGRGNPPPHKLPAEKLREVGLTQDTWRLEVVADPESDAVVDNPLTIENGKAFDWAGLMGLAPKHAVRYLKAMTCTNVSDPCGMGLWEGVPLREVVWMARPRANIRRVFYYGYHNGDPKQRFQSSLSLSRVLEDPPGEEPVILCYKLNGHWLTPPEGGPVRIVVPDQYGNKSVKWLQRVLLTNKPHSNDTYSEWNNDTESPLKTYARFVHVPKEVQAGSVVPLTGLAQVGPAGLSRVQYWLVPQERVLAEDDPYFTKGDWQDAEVLPPPRHWGAGVGDKLPPTTQTDRHGQPKQWPLRNTLVHWAACLEGMPAGKYRLFCRTVDSAGQAQPMPRPFPKSGRNVIHEVALMVHPG